MKSSYILPHKADDLNQLLGLSPSDKPKKSALPKITQKQKKIPTYDMR